MAAKKSAAEKPATKGAPVSKATRRPGRPSRAGDASSAPVTLRLTSEEREVLEQRAAAAGKSLSAYVRDAAMSFRPTKP